MKTRSAPHRIPATTESLTQGLFHTSLWKIALIPGATGALLGASDGRIDFEWLAAVEQ